MQEITSTNNAKIKYLLQLQKKASIRKEFNEFVIEGKREFISALKNNYHIKAVFFYPELFEKNELFEILKELKYKPDLYKINRNIYKKIAYRNSTEGIIVLAKMKQHHLSDLFLSQNPYLLVAEGIEKPGNIGAILRSVDGAGAEALITINPVVDIYNPNVIRASLGMVFSKQIAVAGINEFKEFLKDKKIRLYTADLQNSNVYYNEDYTQPSAIAVGAEDKGLSHEIRQLAYKSVYIPMKGLADSLNVSVSAGILLYEIVRQRNNN